MRQMFAVLTFLLINLGLTSAAQLNSHNLENLNVLQSVDIAGPYIKQSFDLNVQNVGDEPVEGYVFLIPHPRASKLAYFEAKDFRGNPLDVTKIETHSVSGFDLYDVRFEYPLPPRKRVEFAALLAFADGNAPLPAEAKQADSQWLLYNGTKNFPSFYKSRTQITQFNALSEKFEVLSSEETPTLDPSGFLVFGPFEDVAPLETDPLALRFENPLPLAFVEELRRTVWVSHWGGSVSFDESYDLHNVGTKLKPPFSRYDYSKPKIGFSLNNAAVRGAMIKLPEGHREHYFVDLVGNVSTSTVTDTTLNIFPRYPVMGGWFYNFTVGWASDLSRYVRSPSPWNYILSVPVVGGPDKVAFGKVRTKIVLPEGAQNVEFYSEVPCSELEASVTYSYLDLYGRPTVELEYNNLVAEHANSNFTVTYQYTPLAVLRKPVSYAVAVTLVLLAIKFAFKIF